MIAWLPAWAEPLVEDSRKAGEDTAAAGRRVRLDAAPAWDAAIPPPADDPGDALLIQESFGPAEASKRRCHVASRSDQALRFVRRTGEFTDAPGPS